MTLSVPRRNWNKLFELANLYQVSISNIGEFTNDGKFRCFYETTLVCCLDLNFLYQGTPKLNLKAKWKPTTIHSWKKSIPKHMDLKNHDEVMKKLLSIPTLSSKEKWVRQYDHEVQGATVVKPFEGINQTSVNNAGVMWFGALGVSGSDGFSVASGLCPQFSKDDTKLMSQLAVDEAVRNLICHGTDPDKIALVDNFCWPDPIQSSKNPDGEFKLAQLVRSCMGLKEMIEVYQMPLVSGKDSMKNDYSTEGLKISVLPTLLITALGYIPQVEKTIKSQAENKELLYRIGYKNYQQYFGNWLHELDSYQIRDNSMQFNWKEIRELYQRIFEAHQFNLISSMHDISEGGFLVTLFEMLLMNNLGVKLTSNCDSVPFLYSELPGHFIVSIRPESKDEFEKHFSQEVIEYIGSANDEGVIKINSQSLKIKDLAAVWRGQE
jgi:phosphoribosylformylglycinamidine synthase